MFEGIITRLQYRKINLISDPLLRTNINVNYQQSPTQVSFSLFELIFAIGTCRIVADTKTSKFSIALDFLALFTSNNDNELRVLIKDPDVERKQEISRYVGEGLSLVIAEKIFNLKKSTIRKIPRKRNESKPDFMGFKQNLKVVWEAKGSINPLTQTVIDKAVDQKKKEPADIAFAALATLNSGRISEVKIEDPPTLPLRGNRLEQQLSRVMHYVNLFNFIGQPEISKYFKLLGKRLKLDRAFPEYPEKEDLYNKLRKNSKRLTINLHSYLGVIERIGDSVFLYFGFDKRLLSIEDFLNFEDYEEDIIFEQDENKFRITRDGICYGIIRNIDELSELGITEEILLRDIPYYRDTFSIRDFDEMLHFQLVEQIKYYFEREGYEVNKEKIEDDKRFDFIITKRRRKFAVEISKNVIRPFISSLFPYENNYNPVIISTAYISKEDIQTAKKFNVRLIDRKALKQIMRKRRRITEYLEDNEVNS